MGVPRSRTWELYLLQIVAQHPGHRCLPDLVQLVLFEFDNGVDAQIVEIPVAQLQPVKGIKNVSLYRLMNLNRSSIPP